MSIDLRPHSIHDAGFIDPAAGYPGEVLILSKVQIARLFSGRPKTVEDVMQKIGYPRDVIVNALKAVDNELLHRQTPAGIQIALRQEHKVGAFLADHGSRKTKWRLGAGLGAGGNQ